MPRVDIQVDPADLLTVSTVARLLCRPESTIRAWIRRGRLLPIARTPSGVHLYWRPDVERLRAAIEAA